MTTWPRRATAYHYTCTDHGAVGILQSGQIIPGHRGLAWFTDLPPDTPDLRAALGLTSHILKCDRMEVVFEVPLLGMSRWTPDFQNLYDLELIQAPGARPDHWLVARKPLAVPRALMQKLVTTP